MNHQDSNRVRLRTRAAYTLLELMLALALLGALMTVAWSLMGTFSSAEQRGWKLAHRIQTIRAAREWLQTDMQQLVQNEPVSANAKAKKSRLTGNSLGFTALIAPSIDPLPFLEDVMSSSAAGPGARTNTKAELEPAASLYSDSEAIVAQAQKSLWPAETLEVQYKLAPDESSTAVESSSLLVTDLSEVQFSLTRSELVDANSVQNNQRSPGLSQQTNNFADRVLTAQDLYRETNETVLSSGMALRETRLDGLTNVQFQYFDGVSWQREWNSEQAGGLPRAIALCFDFPSRANMKPPEPKTTSSENGLSDPSDLLTSNPVGTDMAFANAALAAEPTGEPSSGIETSLMQSATHEFQIIVHVGGQAKSTSSKQSFGSPHGTSARGGLE